MRPVEAQSSARSHLLVYSLVSLITVSVANTTATAVAQPSIAAAFGASPADVGAVVFGYLSTFAVTTAIYGGSARRFGTSRVLAFGAGLLVIGAAGAIVAPSLGWLVAARVLQGAGAGAIPTMSFSIMAERLQGPWRARALGLHVAGVGVGQTLGPLAGGLLIDLVSWRAAVGIGVMATPGLVLVLLLHPTRRQPGFRVDLVGAIGLAITVVSAFWLLSRGLTRGPIGVRVAAAVFVALAAAFTWRHLSRSSRPFVPRLVFESTALWRPVLLAAVGMATFTTIITGLPLVLGTGGERVQGVELGLLLLPMAAAVALVSPRNGLVVTGLGRSPTTALSYLVMGAGCLTAALLVPGGVTTALAIGLIPMGIGFGLLNAPLAGEVSAAFEIGERSQALGLYNLGFFMGGATGSALVSAIVDRGAEASVGGFQVAVGLTIAALFLACLVSALTRPRERREGPHSD